MGQTSDTLRALDASSRWVEDHIQDIQAKEEELGASISVVYDRLNQLLHLMQDMVKLEGHINDVEERILSRLDKLAAAQVDSSKLVDRLIEMSMVNRGQSQDAVIHRAQARVESNFSNPQSWVEEITPEDVWPPKGCDAVDITG